MKFLQDMNIKKAVKSEKVKAPDNFSKIIDETLNGLEDNYRGANKKTAFRITFKFASAMTVLVLLILPNISNDISYAMQGIPVVGNIVKAITIRRYFEKEGKSELDIEIPVIEDEDKTSQIVNDDVNELTQRIIDMYNEEKDPENHLSVKLESEVLENSEDWFTLKLELSEVRAGSNIRYKIYHVDKKKDKIITLAELFVSDDFKESINNEIKKQMLSRMTEDESVVYWVNNKIEDWNFKTIEENQEFYFSEDGNIVIVFDKYEVAPGAMGTPEFEIDKEVYKMFLKEEYK
ncbi:MAG: DUF3298 domain-containing protein [Clostridia bacterium]|jgi:hypothetical protein|nr:DUF3298 domain-containing protein [Clostridia bacterium]